MQATEMNHLLSMLTLAWGGEQTEPRLGDVNSKHRKAAPPGMVCIRDWDA